VNDAQSSARNETAGYWEGLFASRAWGLYPAEDLVRFMGRTFRHVSDRSRVRVLEIGCGPGPNIWYLAREGFTVAGIDGSPTAIQQALERLSRENLPSGQPTVDLRTGDFRQLDWPDASFDAVLDIEALYSNRMSGIAESVAEVRRVLKPHGVFFGKMFGLATTGSESGESLEPGTRRGPTAGPCAGNEIAHFFSREELMALFGEFKSLEIDHLDRTEGGGQVRIFEWLVRARK
jgi:SAM-dependent methyltransferase